MRQSLDMGRLFTKRESNASSPAPEAEKRKTATTGGDDKTSRNGSVRDFWKSNISSISRRVSRRGRRNTKVNLNNGSKRASRILDLSTTNAAIDKERLMLSSDEASDSSREVATITTVTNVDLRPLTANPVSESNRLTKMTTVTEELPPPVLSEDELKLYFYGAPEFRQFALDESGTPQITYYDINPAHLEDTRDYVDLAHLTFATSTNKQPLAVMLTALKSTPDALRAICEVPNMMSFQGLEPGSCGYDHFLQQPISDSKTVDEDFENSLNRQILAASPDKLGLRPLNIEYLIDRLSELSDAFQQQKRSEDPLVAINEQKAAEMYAELTAKLLNPPGYAASDEQGPTGLRVQAQALVEILEERNLWYDFSLVEQRIRLGQVIWVSDEYVNSKDEVSERDLVLLQITLASELFIRLEALDNMKSQTENAETLEVSRKVSWDLILGKRFLDNVRIMPAQIAKSKADKAQNRASLFSMLSFVTAREDPEEEPAVEPILYPRHERKQLEGLVRFAEILQWPHVSDISSKLEDRINKSTEMAFGAFATPIATPGTPGLKRDSYFGAATLRPSYNRTLTAQSVQLLPPSSYDSTFDAGGWLSRSWLTGLVLPGECASHFLISTLLENSPDAINALGDSASLYGGFCYKGRSYWSKSCVVGRVLTPSPGSAEVMGWISTPHTPAKQSDGWISIESHHIPTSNSRISNPDLITSSSSTYPRAATGTLTADDFVYPSDGPQIMGNEASFSALRFDASDTQFELSASLAATSTSTAECKFTSLSNKKLPPLTLQLKWEISFVSSVPCFPQPRRSPLSSPRQSSGDITRRDKDLPGLPCHALHKEYRYVLEAVAALIAEAEHFLAFANEKDTGDEDGEILVLDCRGSPDLEILGRAWCASVGLNALIGREGRTCLGCCIREARGLGMRVVLRV